MEHRIVELESFKLVGFKKESTNDKRQGMKDCPAFWNEILSSGKQEALLPLINHEPFGLIGASFYNVDEQDAKRFDYYIAAATTSDTPAELAEVEVSGNTWAVFPCTRKTSGKTQFEIVTKWAPESTEYALLNDGYATGEMTSAGPDLEVYGQGDEIEIWVPVRRK
ncbi:GyrI-like domain-containing protein [Enterococcus sp.]|uniref:GyrI-like domain-containing protein n=1 Tax=Enterococcus sp. TaxID=35783 RepID=UPI00290946DD|nr:GyrI-like domain-containing protein [Enterococcus sp.]MDU5334556.1 GyrI-like domain-containing protein [Enterococcus sp.]